MSAYHRVLAAVDLTEDSRAVAARAADISRLSGADIYLLHVVEFMPLEPMSDTLVSVAQIDDRTMERAGTQITALATQFGIPAERVAVKAGTAKGEIVRYAREKSCDLIVLGSRERHGLSILVNHTEDTVLHGAPCDVLAVRVR